jgi:hypothetical protein
MDYHELYEWHQRRTERAYEAVYIALAIRGLSADLWEKVRGECKLRWDNGDRREDFTAIANAALDSLGLFGQSNPYQAKPDTEKSEAEIEADNNLFIESMKRNTK